jgi:hypothetical protein
MTFPRNTSSQPNRPDPSVFRRRRIIALAVLATLVVIIWAVVSAIASWFGATFGSDGTPTPMATDGSSSTVGTACAPADISIVGIVANAAGSSQSAFASGINPYFGYQITNNSAADCTFDVGALTTFYTVTSGTETIWTSEQCDRTTLTALPMVLKAGQMTPSDLGEWFAVYSSVKGCGSEQNKVTGDGASYHLSVSVGGVSTKDTVQFLLN